MTLLFLLRQERRIRGLEVKKLTANTHKHFCGKLCKRLHEYFKKNNLLVLIKHVLNTKILEYYLYYIIDKGKTNCVGVLKALNAKAKKKEIV